MLSPNEIPTRIASELGNSDNYLTDDCYCGDVVAGAANPPDAINANNAINACAPSLPDPHESQNALVLESLIKFYAQGNNLNVALSVITESTQMSLRIIDWFVTNYAKKNYTSYVVHRKNKPNYRIKVYTDYRLALSSYKKRRFDPFCRRGRIEFPCDGNRVFQTTIGQMNFFKWVSENDILQYIKAHYKEIEDDMNQRNSTSRRKKNPALNGTAKKTRKKREELSSSAAKFMKKEIFELMDEPLEYEDDNGPI